MVRQTAVTANNDDSGKEGSQREEEGEVNQHPSHVS